MAIRIGPITLVCWAAGYAGTAALLFLGIVTWEFIWQPFILFFVLPMIVSLAGAVSGLTSKGPLEGHTLATVAISLVLIFVNVMVANALFGYQVTPYDNILIGVLFAIYEETFFLMLAALTQPAGMLASILVADVFFVGLHALAYPATFMMDLFLLIGRTVMTATLVLTKNSDSAFLIHIIWNVMASMGGT